MYNGVVMTPEQLRLLTKHPLGSEVLNSMKLQLITTMTAASLLKQIALGEL